MNRPVWLVLAGLLLAAASAGAQTTPPRDGGTALYLHRDGSLGLDAPTSADDAVFAFGLQGPHNVTFQTAPLPAPLELASPTLLRLTIGPPEISLRGRLVSVLSLDGAAIAESSSQDLLVDLREREVALSFLELNQTAPAGSVLALEVRLVPFLDVGGLSVLDVSASLLYDSTAHPGGLVLPSLGGAGDGLGVPGPEGPGGPGGRSGTDPLDRAGFPDPSTSLGLAPLDPFIVMAGVGTSAIALTASLALRGRMGP